MKKGIGSGDPDPLVRGTDSHQNVTDPQHCVIAWIFQLHHSKRDDQKSTYNRHTGNSIPCWM
jgi:hypothetical protein